MDRTDQTATNCCSEYPYYGCKYREQPCHLSIWTVPLPNFLNMRPQLGRTSSSRCCPRQASQEDLNKTQPPIHFTTKPGRLRILGSTANWLSVWKRGKCWFAWAPPFLETVALFPGIRVAGQQTDKSSHSWKQMMEAAWLQPRLAAEMSMDNQLPLKHRSMTFAHVHTSPTITEDLGEEGCSLMTADHRVHSPSW